MSVEDEWTRSPKKKTPPAVAIRNRLEKLRAEEIQLKAKLDFIAVLKQAGASEVLTTTLLQKDDVADCLAVLACNDIKLVYQKPTPRA